MVSLLRSGRRLAGHAGRSSGTGSGSCSGGARVANKIPHGIVTGAALKLHTEAAELAIRPDWAISVLGAAKGGTAPRQYTKDELRELVLELKAELAELKRASTFSG
ncbi:hypothetical protein OUZ56_029865 [Daphnia magna]|uniref:Uncharacterized protein n=1 Tax=Daphnia magna TaxID=35525 RepID=A0ABR0B822_9CRUS|nr:hypothetical protein OUZ56_029865 [Daphnia magna]